MSELDKATSTRNGVSLDNLTGLFSFVGDPSASGFDAPLGCLILATDGKLWQKKTAPTTGWVELTPGAGAIGMDDLTDADTTTTPPSDGDNLVWSTTLNNWVPATAAQDSGSYGSNYIFSYDTATQIVVAANTFQDVTYTNNSFLDGWTHTPGSADFVAAATGLYIVTYEYNVEKNGGGNIEVATEATLAGAAVAMSRNGMDITSNNTAFPLSRSFPLEVTAIGQIMKIHIAANTANRASIIPAPAPGGPSPAIGGTLTIRRMT